MAGSILRGRNKQFLDCMNVGIATAAIDFPDMFLPAIKEKNRMR